MEYRLFARQGRKSRFGAEWRVDGKKFRKFFQTKQQREDWVTEQQEKTRRFGEGVLSVSDADVAELRLAKDLLPAGVGILEAVRFYARSHLVVSPMELKGAAEEFLEFCTFTKQMSDGAIRNRKCLLEKIRQRFGDAIPVSAVDGVHLQEWVTSRPVVPVTKRDYVKRLNEFFKFCMSRGWCGVNPAEGLVTPAVPESEPEFMRPAAVKDLLAKASEESPELVLYLVLGFFAGMRTSQCARMEPGFVNWAEKGITLPGATHKTKRRFYVEGFPEVLWDWLEQCRGKGRFSCGWGLPLQTFKNRRAALCKKHGIDFPHNAARHSFCTYHIALAGSAERTATLLTHRGSVSMLYNHYRGNATKRDAEKYFASAS